MARFCALSKRRVRPGNLSHRAVGDVSSEFSDTCGAASYGIFDSQILGTVFAKFGCASSLNLYQLRFGQETQHAEEKSRPVPHIGHIV